MKKFLLCGIIGPAALLICASVHVYAHEGESHPAKLLFTKHFEETLFDVTDRAAYSVELLLDDKEFDIGKNVVGIVVHGAGDEDVVGAELVITHKDLATGIIAPGKLAVVDKKNGLYTVSGLDLKKAGRWELRIIVKKAGVEDSIRFVLPDALKDHVPKGRYSP